jgi:phosphate transport system substrate-binding protein
MKQDIWMKVIITIFLVGFLLFIGFFGTIFTLLMGGERFYTPLFVVFIGGIIIYSVLRIFKAIKPKLLDIGVVAFISLCLITMIGYQAYHVYLENMTMRNHEVDLYEYQPFAENTKAVKLEVKSTLKLEDDLPILDGATALYPLYSAFVQATYPEKQYDVYTSGVMSNKTGTAYENLINGKVDIIFAAGPSEAQLQMAEEKGLELKMTPIGREAFVFFVNAKNPVEGVTIEQIQGIYSGEIMNWFQLGWKNEEIRAFQRPENSGSQTGLVKLMGDIPLMKPPTEDIVTGMGGIIKNTSDYRNYKNAIGFSYRYFSTEMVQNGDIKLLKINDVFPSKETIRSGEYPLSAQFYAITARTDNPHVEELIDWILSEQGQSLVEKTGYVSVGGVKKR